MLPASEGVAGLQITLGRQERTVGDRPPVAARNVGPGRYVPAMEFTALHRLLGRQAGPLTDDMLDAAIEQGIRETDDLDWKSALPKAKDLSQSDVVKDIAAMANSGAA